MIISTLVNYTFGKKHGIVKTCCIVAFVFGFLLTIGKVFGFSFAGIEFILVYAIYYGFGWVLKRTVQKWKPLWGEFSGIVTFVALIIYITIIFNFDLYHNYGFVALGVKYLAGFSGNIVIFAICSKYKDFLNKVKLNRLGINKVIRNVLKDYEVKKK